MNKCAGQQVSIYDFFDEPEPVPVKPAITYVPTPARRASSDSDGFSPRLGNRAARPILSDLVAVLRGLHVKTQTGACCTECQQDWPCPTLIAVDTHYPGYGKQ